MTDQLPPDWDRTWGVAPTPTPPPPGGGPGPGPAVGGPEPRRARRSRAGRAARAILAIAALGIVVVVIAAIGIVVLLGLSTRGPVSATNGFVAALDEGRIDDAYDDLCPELQADLAEEDFAEVVVGASRITGYTFLGSPRPFERRTVVSGTIELDGEPVATNFELENIDGDWRICAFDPIPEAG